MSNSPMIGCVEPRLQLLPGVGLADLNHPQPTDRLAGIVAEQLEAFQTSMRQSLLAASVAVGFGVLGEFLAAEEAGPKARHNPECKAVRHGTERVTVPLGQGARGQAPPTPLARSAWTPPSTSSERTRTT